MNTERDEDPFDGIHNPTVYGSRAEMNAVEKDEIPFNDPPDDGCWNCLEYNGNFCMKEWNNLDECYKVVWRDSKDPFDRCEDWNHDPDASIEDYIGSEE